MSEMHPVEGRGIAGATEAEITAASRGVRTNYERLAETGVRMKQNHRALFAFLMKSLSSLVTYEPALSQSGMAGMVAAYQLLENVAAAQGAELPAEIPPAAGDAISDIYETASLSYGLNEKPRDRGAVVDLAGKIAAGGYDVFAEHSDFRLLEDRHPLYAAQGARFAARAQTRPMAHFEDFLRTGSTAGSMALAPSQLPGRDITVDVREYDRFFEFLNYFSATAGNLLVLEEKTTFAQAFGFDTEA